MRVNLTKHLQFDDSRNFLFSTVCAGTANTRRKPSSEEIAASAAAGGARLCNAPGIGEAAVGIAVTAIGTEKPWRAFPDLDWASERGKRKMKLLNSTKQPTQSFASVLLACSLFGFVFSHHANSANEPHHMNFIQKSEAHQNDDDSWYTPLRSPGFNEDFGS